MLPRGCVFHLLISGVLAGFAPATPGWAQEHPVDPRADVMHMDAIRLRDVSMRLWMHAESAQMTLPASLADPDLEDDPAERYEYIGIKGVSFEDVGEWSTLAIAHVPLDEAYQGPPTAQNPSGLLVPILFLDGHVQFTSKEDAEAIIKESRAVYEAIDTGEPLPDARQSAWNVRAIVAAARAFAEDHDGLLPPDMGTLLAYVPTDPKRTPTLRDRAGVFLAPRAARRTFIPEEPTGAWVERNTGYDYLAAIGDGPAAMLAPLDEIEDPSRTALVVLKPTHAIDVTGPMGNERSVITVGTVGGGIQGAHPDLARWQAEQSRTVINASRSEDVALPDLTHMARDLGLLAFAYRSYAADNDGHLAPDLGSLLGYLTPDMGGAQVPPADAASRARVFLSPRAEAITQIPSGEPTREWINRHASYVLTVKPGRDGITTLAELDSGAVLILLHAPLDEPVDAVRSDGKPERVVPLVFPQGGATWWEPGFIEQAMAEHREAVGEAQDHP